MNKLNLAQTKMRLSFLLLGVSLLFISLPGFGQDKNSGSALNNLMYKQDFRAYRESSANPDLSKNGDNVSVGPGETIELGNLTGPGIINHIWMTISSSDPFYGRSMVLRMYWEGNEKPSVETPLGDFFGVGHGAHADFESSPISTSSFGRSRNSFWKMPFLQNAKITLTNESQEYSANVYYYLDWEKHNSLPKDILYFHANYKQQFPATQGDYTLLDIEGKGQYVGTIFSNQNMDIGWFGEGDDRFYIDGEENPSLRGTGTEDYFGDAWGFRQFHRDYYGVSLWEGYFPGDRTTAYRWHIEDPIPFEKSIKVAMEHRGSIYTDKASMLSGFAERPDWISSVAIWYQTEPTELKETIPPIAERIAPYKVLTPKDLKIKAFPKMLLNESEDEFYFTPVISQGYIKFIFNVEKEGTYQISANITHNMFSSVFKVSLDGKRIGDEIDLYLSGNDVLPINFDLHKLSAGKHTLKFKVKHTSPKMRSMARKAHFFSLDNIIFLRLEDMDGYNKAFKELSAKK